ncbi:MAG: hypothetical protein QF393_14115 [Rhodospirillales bacterium]|jgi:hypothetical protein|nr:hypothetical protein [Rhodospirillaceae bacterium]MDP6429147.1 hypothetical protein [Rhodospirillales bacterium]MDP6645669.1 hypothetical protein [Rhodospirillales bacterium]
MRSIVFIVALLLIALIALLPPPARAQGIKGFLDSHHEQSSVWNLECYQGGKKIIAAAKLRIGRYKGKTGAAGRFADEHGREVAILPSADTACIARQLSGRRVRAAAPRQGGLPMLRPERKK